MALRFACKEIDQWTENEPTQRRQRHDGGRAKRDGKGWLQDTKEDVRERVDQIAKDNRSDPGAKAHEQAHGDQYLGFTRTDALQPPPSTRRNCDLSHRRSGPSVRSTGRVTPQSSAASQGRHDAALEASKHGLARSTAACPRGRTHARSGTIGRMSEIDAAAMVHMSVHCTGQRGAPAGSRMVTLIGSVCPESRLARSLTYVQPCT